MDALFQTAIIFRTQLAQKIEKADERKLDLLVSGFNNTIRWQIAHLIATQTLLTYNKVSQMSPLISEEFIDSCKKGTNQENFNLGEDYGTSHLLEFLVETTKQLQRDYKKLKKLEFQSYETSTGLVLKDIDTALAYSNIHDGIHIGNIYAILATLED